MKTKKQHYIVLRGDELLGAFTYHRIGSVESHLDDSYDFRAVRRDQFVNHGSIIRHADDAVLVMNRSGAKSWESPHGYIYKRVN